MRHGKDTFKIGRTASHRRNIYPRSGRSKTDLETIWRCSRSFPDRPRSSQIDPDLGKPSPDRFQIDSRSFPDRFQIDSRSFPDRVLLSGSDLAYLPMFFQNPKPEMSKRTFREHLATKTSLPISPRSCCYVSVQKKVFS